jgi:hypothetical protein
VSKSNRRSPEDATGRLWAGHRCLAALIWVYDHKQPVAREQRAAWPAVTAKWDECRPSGDTSCPCQPAKFLREDYVAASGGHEVAVWARLLGTVTRCLSDCRTFQDHCD